MSEHKEGYTPSISAVLPAYNEEKVIADAAKSVAAALEEVTDDYEVVVVNDGSHDATRQVVEAVRPSPGRTPKFGA